MQKFTMSKVGKRLILVGLLTMLSTGLAGAIDLADFDDDSMRDMDEANKDLGPVLGAKNAEAALADAKVIQDVLKETEAYFAKKGSTDNAVKIAQQGQSSVAAVLDALRTSNFDAAAAAARDTSKNCRSCHDLYKPLTK
jgi:cytochrome c556